MGNDSMLYLLSCLLKSINQHTVYGYRSDDPSVHSAAIVDNASCSLEGKELVH